MIYNKKMGYNAREMGYCEKIWILSVMKQLTGFINFGKLI